MWTNTLAGSGDCLFCENKERNASWSINIYRCGEKVTVHVTTDKPVWRKKSWKMSLQFVNATSLAVQLQFLVEKLEFPNFQRNLNAALLYFILFITSHLFKDSCLNPFLCHFTVQMKPQTCSRSWEYFPNSLWLVWMIMDYGCDDWRILTQ